MTGHKVRLLEIFVELSVLAMVAVFSFACAGPSTPFGAVPANRLLHPAEGKDTEDSDDTEVAQKSAAASIFFADNSKPDVQKVVTLGNMATAGAVAEASGATAAAAAADAASAAAAAIPAAPVDPAKVFGPAKPERLAYGPEKEKPDPKKVTGSDSQTHGPASVAQTNAAHSAPVTPAGMDPERLTRPRITFNPRRQVLHGRTLFTVNVEDPAGIPRDHEIMLLYNGIDMTSSFMAQADETVEGRPPTKLKIVFENLRLPANRDNKIEVIYWHAHNDRPAYAIFAPPRCSAFMPAKIASTGDFEIPTKLLDEISADAVKFRLNPTYVAGLIAQESAFDEKAVSSAKALGLTQITPVAEDEIIGAQTEWPRYPNINSLPSPILKVKVAVGKINAKNEWRLNPSMSVMGGVEYLNFLNEWWRKPANFSMITNNFKDVDAAMSQLILASYNSGPARVSSALQSHGRRWLRDDGDLNEARRYVRRVLSYCDYFSRQEEDADVDSP